MLTSNRFISLTGYSAAKAAGPPRGEIFVCASGCPLATALALGLVSFRHVL
jgi:hypothetical protein